MKVKSIILLILCTLLTVCDCSTYNGEEQPEEQISYTSYFYGNWECVEVVAYCDHASMRPKEEVDSLVGKKYEFSEQSIKEMEGGKIPIRDVNSQFFYWPEYPYFLSEIGVGGEYYVIVENAENKYKDHPCFFPIGPNEMLVTEAWKGIYRLKRISTDEKQIENSYDAERTLEENIHNRLDTQGIKESIYFTQCEAGNWTIVEVVYAENKAEAKKHLGEIVEGAYYTKLDVEFIDTPEERIFYNMPTVEELGLSGAYYVLLYDEKEQYPAAIIKSEHEMFLIRGNTVYKAVQEETYLDDALLQAG